MAFGFSRLTALLALCGACGAFAQLSGSVGPTTSLSQKQGTICNVLNYGGSVGSSVSSLIPHHCYIRAHEAKLLRIGYRPRYWQSLHRLCEEGL